MITEHTYTVLGLIPNYHRLVEPSFKGLSFTAKGSKFQNYQGISGKTEGCNLMPSGKLRF